MKKIVKLHKARKPSASTDVPSFARGKDQILKSPTRLQRRKKNELGEFDTGKDNSVIQNTAAYNQWRSTLPKNLQTETPDYDLYGAFEAGLQPKWDDKDKSYHLGSRDPETGRILKRPTHPTFGKAIWSDMSLGYYPIYRDGEIYTEQPIKYVDISKYKGGKDEPWYDKLNDSSVGSIIKLIDPTGVSSYYDVYKAGQDMYNNPSWSNAGSLAIETLGAIPLVGKFGKMFKLGNKLVKNSTGVGEDIGKEIFNWLGPRLIPTGKDMYDDDQSQYDKGKDSAGNYVNAIYSNNPKEHFLGKPSHNYDFTIPEEEADRLGYYPDARGHRDDRVKKLAHPTHPRRGTWNGDEFVLTDFGMRDPNYTMFGVVDGGQDPQSILTYKGGVVLPEFTVTPDRNYIMNNYDNILLEFNKGKDSGIHIKKANRGKFTAAAKRAGMGVQAYARKILNAPKGKYSSTLRKRANFAANAAKWH